MADCEEVPGIEPHPNLIPEGPLNPEARKKIAEAVAADEEACDAMKWNIIEGYILSLDNDGFTARAIANKFDIGEDLALKILQDHPASLVLRKSRTGDGRKIFMHKEKAKGFKFWSQELRSSMKNVF